MRNKHRAPGSGKGTQLGAQLREGNKSYPKQALAILLELNHALATGFEKHVPNLSATTVPEHARDHPLLLRKKKKAPHSFALIGQPVWHLA